MSDNLKGSVEGLITGILGGLAIGFIDADWPRMIIAFALPAYAGRIMHVNTFKPAVSYRIGISCLSAFVAVLFGLYVERQQFVSQSPETAIATFVKAGHSPDQAREIYVTKILPGLQKKAIPPQPAQTGPSN